MLAIVTLSEMYGSIALRLDVIPSETRDAALVMITSRMRQLVGDYALYCARVAMQLKMIALEEQRELGAYAAYQRKYNGLRLPRVFVHPVVQMTASDVYIMTALEFV
jgi:hypothetical protein